MWMRIVMHRAELRSRETDLRMERRSCLSPICAVKQKAWTVGANVRRCILLDSGVMRLSASRLAALVDSSDWARLHASDIPRPFRDEDWLGPSEQPAARSVERATPTVW
jgi:hypothetical protein